MANDQKGLLRLEEAITDFWGAPCSSFDPDCPTCQAWAEYNSHFTTPAKPVLVDTGDRVAHAFRNADDSDWRHLFAAIPDTGRGRFWKAVFTEVQAALKPVQKGK